MSETLFCLDESEVKAIIMSLLKARGDKGAQESEIEKILCYYDQVRFENELLRGVLDGAIGTTIVNREVVFVHPEYEWHPQDRHDKWRQKQTSKGLCVKCMEPATSKTLCDFHRQKKRAAYLKTKGK